MTRRSKSDVISFPAPRTAMQNSHLPTGSTLLVDTTGAIIEAPDDPSSAPDIYLPKHHELISHIALDVRPARVCAPLTVQIGGSLAKVVYFTRAPRADAILPRSPSPPDSPARPNGILGPKALSQHAPRDSPVASTSAGRPLVSKSSKARRSSTTRAPPGGRLNFIKFETTDLSSCIDFISTLISSSAESNRVPIEVMKQNVKIMATGGGAHMFHERLRDELGVEVRREEEMECLVLGLGFVMEVPNEVFWYSDELVQAISHPHSTPALPPTDDFPRPSPNPPQYSLSFDANPTSAQFPCLLVNIGSGVSIIKVDDYGKFERISGTSLGGGTLWGLLSLLTGAKSFDGAWRALGRGRS